MENKMNKILNVAIILSLTLGSMLSVLNAGPGRMGNLPGKMNKKTLPGKKVNGSYHSICMELLKKKEYKAKLTKQEIAVVNQYVTKGRISSKKIHHLESAIKKHSCVVAKNPNKKKNLISAPKGNDVGKWYIFECSGAKGTKSTGNNAKSQNQGGSAN